MIGRGIGGIDIDMSSPVKPLSLPQSAGVSRTGERERGESFLLGFEVVLTRG